MGDVFQGSKSTCQNQATLIFKILFNKACFEVSSLCGKENEKKGVKCFDSRILKCYKNSLGCFGLWLLDGVCEGSLSKA